MLKVFKEILLMCVCFVFLTVHCQALSIFKPVLNYTVVSHRTSIEPSTNINKVQGTTISLLNETMRRNLKINAFTESNGHANNNKYRFALDNSILKGVQEIKNELEFVEKKCAENTSVQDAAPEIKLICSDQPSHVVNIKDALKANFVTQKTIETLIENKEKEELEDLKKSLGFNKQLAPDNVKVVIEKVTEMSFSPQTIENTSKLIVKSKNKIETESQNLESSKESIIEKYIQNNQKEFNKGLKNNDATTEKKEKKVINTIATEFTLSSPFTSNTDVRIKDEDHLKPLAFESENKEFEPGETIKYTTIPQSFQNITIINNKNAQDLKELNKILSFSGHKIKSAVDEFISGTETTLSEDINPSESEDDSILNTQKHSTTLQAHAPNDKITQVSYTQPPYEEEITTSVTTKTKSIVINKYTKKKTGEKTLTKQYFDSDSDMEATASLPTSKNMEIKSEGSTSDPDNEDEENDSDAATELVIKTLRYDKPSVNILQSKFNKDNDATENTAPRYSMRPIIWKNERTTAKCCTFTVEEFSPFILYDSKLVTPRNKNKLSDRVKSHSNKVKTQKQSNEDRNIEGQTDGKVKSDENKSHMISIKNYKPKNIFNHPTIILKESVSELTENDPKDDSNPPDFKSTSSNLKKVAKKKNKLKDNKETQISDQENPNSTVDELLNLMTNYVKDQMSVEGSGRPDSDLGMNNGTEESRVINLKKSHVVQTTERDNVAFVTKKKPSIKIVDKNSGNKCLDSKTLQALLKTMLANLKRMLDRRDKSVMNYNWMDSAIKIQVGIEKILRLCVNKNAAKLDAKLIAFTDTLFSATLDCIPGELRTHKLDKTYLYFTEILNYLYPLHKVIDNLSSKKNNQDMFNDIKKNYLHATTDKKLMTILMHSAANRILEQIDAKFEDAKVNDKLKAVLEGGKQDHRVKITFARGGDNHKTTDIPAVDIKKTYADIIEDMVLVYTILNQFITKKTLELKSKAS